MVLQQSTPGRGTRDLQEKTQPNTSAFAETLQLACRGDSEGLSTLYRQFLPAVFGYIAARVADRETAEDLTSEVFLKMIAGIRGLRTTEEAGFAAWLLQIARFTVAGHYRKQARLPVVQPLDILALEEQEEAVSVLPTDNACSDPLDWLVARDEWRAVVEAMNQLTEEQRQVLISRLILEYDVATVARMLGKTASAVKSLQFRALQSLQRLLTHQVAMHQQLQQGERTR